MLDVNIYSYVFIFIISENLWHEFKHYIRNVCKPDTKEQLISGIKRFWKDRVTPTKCQRYISHLRKVVLRVIELEGAATGM